MPSFTFLLCIPVKRVTCAEGESQNPYREHSLQTCKRLRYATSVFRSGCRTARQRVSRPLLHCPECIPLNTRAGAYSLELYFQKLHTESSSSVLFDLNVMIYLLRFCLNNPDWGDFPSSKTAWCGERDEGLADYLTQ